MVGAVGLHQRASPFGHVGLLLDVRVVPDQVGMEHRVRRRRRALADQRHIGVPVGRERQSLAGPDVVEGRALGVDHREPFDGARVLDGRDALGLTHDESRLGAAGDHQVEVPGGQPLRGDGHVGDRLDLDAVEVYVDAVRRPVVGVAHQHRHLVLDAAGDHEGPLAHRHLVHGRIVAGPLQPLRRQDHPKLAGQHHRQSGHRPWHPELDGEVVDLVHEVAGLHRVAVDQRDHRIGELRGQGVDHVVRGELGAVVKANPLAQLHLPDGAVADPGERLGQVGDPVALPVEVGERIEHRVGHDVGGRREVVGCGVEAVALGLHGHSQRAAELRLDGYGRPLRSGVDRGDQKPVARLGLFFPGLRVGPGIGTCRVRPAHPVLAAAVAGAAVGGAGRVSRVPGVR